MAWWLTLGLQSRTAWVTTPLCPHLTLRPGKRFACLHFSLLAVERGGLSPLTAQGCSESRARWCTWAP